MISLKEIPKNKIASCNSCNVTSYADADDPKHEIRKLYELSVGDNFTINVVLCEKCLRNLFNKIDMLLN